MTKYVALLRGINFGGRNKIEMLKLKIVFESLNFTHVKTYLNSGNVIFSDKSKSIKKITEQIEKVILDNFQLEVKVLVRDNKNIKETLKSVPSSWENETGKQVHVVFLFDEIDNPNVLDQPEVNINTDKVKYIKGSILWNVDLKNWNKGPVYKFVNGKIAKYTTVRSVNTVKKLNELLI